MQKINEAAVLIFSSHKSVHSIEVCVYNLSDLSACTFNCNCYTSLLLMYLICFGLTFLLQVSSILILSFQICELGLCNTFLQQKITSTAVMLYDKFDCYGFPQTFNIIMQMFNSLHFYTPLAKSTDFLDSFVF